VDESDGKGRRLDGCRETIVGDCRASFQDGFANLQTVADGPELMFIIHQSPASGVPIGRALLFLQQTIRRAVQGRSTVLLACINRLGADLEGDTLCIWDKHVEQVSRSERGRVERGRGANREVGARSCDGVEVGGAFPSLTASSRSVGFRGG
jgi:hypothetical protein